MITKNQFCEVHLLDDGTYVAEFLDGEVITHDEHYETEKEMKSSCIEYIEAGLFGIHVVWFTPVRKKSQHQNNTLVF